MSKKFQLTTEQQLIFDAIVKRDKQVSVLMGAAGTGKTTLASRIIEEYQVQRKSLLLLAPTVTALSNLQKRTQGFVYGMTTARLLKTPVQYFSIMGEKYCLSKQHEVEKLSQYLFKSFGFDSDEFISRKDSDHPYAVNELLLTDAFEIKFGSNPKILKQFEFETFVEFEDKSDNEIIKELSDTSVVILDEATMVNNEDMLLLVRCCEQAKCALLVCGDPYQLPPVTGSLNSYMNNTRTKEDGFYLLKQVLRSSDDVIDIATRIKNKAPLKVLQPMFPHTIEVVEDLQRLTKPQLRELVNSDMVLAFQNKDIRYLNQEIRKVLNKPDHVEHDDKLVCMQNVRAPKYPAIQEFYNAEQFKVLQVYEKNIGWNYVAQIYNISKSNDKRAIALHDAFAKGKLVLAEVESTATEETKLCIMESLKFFLKAAVRRTLETYLKDLAIELIKNQNINEDVRHEEMKRLDYDVLECANAQLLFPPIVRMQFGYAMTVHKSQGSEWDNVVYYTNAKDLWITKTPNLPYTAVTRAKSKLKILYSSSF